MQQLKHTHFTTSPTGRHMQHEQSSLPIRNCYFQLSAGFAAIGFKSNDDKIRPWFKRQEA